MKPVILKPRNGHTAVMRFRKSGAHNKSAKAQRQKDKSQLKKQDFSNT